MQFVFAALRRVQTYWATFGLRYVLTYGHNRHVVRGTRIWAPKTPRIGSHVYIGKHVNIEANCVIGDFCLIANRVAIVGRHDHDFAAVDFPMRYAPWIDRKRWPSPYLDEKAVIGADVWLGFGAVVLTGVTIGRGAVVAAGSVVTSALPPYCIAAGVPAQVYCQANCSNTTLEMRHKPIH